MFKETARRAAKELSDLLREAKDTFPSNKCRGALETAQIAMVSLGCDFGGYLNRYNDFVREAREYGFELPEMPLNCENEPLILFTGEETEVERNRLLSAQEILQAYLNLEELKSQLKKYRLLKALDKYITR